MCLVSRHTPACLGDDVVMCGHSRVNLEKYQNPDEMDAVWVGMFCSGDRPCQLSSKEKDGGGGRRHNAAQEHKQARTKIDTTPH